MYVKLFSSIYQGTLRGNAHGLLVFTNLLAHADKEGYADIHPKAVAEEVGLPIDAVQRALEELESPDPESRSPDEEGRRITRLDEHRAWGWRIVNYAKYRAIRDEAERREQNRAAQERYRERNNSKPPSAKVSRAKPISAHTDTEADTEASITLTTSESSKPKVLPCPYQTIVDLYHEVLPELPSVAKLTDARKAQLRQRWAEGENDLDDWRLFFEHVRKSEFLMGRTKDRNGGKPFVASLEWLTKPANFVKVVEGNYHR